MRCKVNYTAQVYVKKHKIHNEGGKPSFAADAKMQLEWVKPDVRRLLQST